MPVVSSIPKEGLKQLHAHGDGHSGPLSSGGAKADAGDKADAVTGGEEAGVDEAEEDLTGADPLDKKAARQRMRQRMRAKLDALEQQKPAEDAEDPADVEAIRVANATMGDYKLKTSSEYVVPEDERVNAEKKRRQAEKKG